MTQVMSLDELDAHNEFYYDPATGEVTVSVATFSLFTMATSEAVWNGKRDYKWYDANATELYIANADQLAGFGAIVGGMDGQTQDSFKGKTVKLICDIPIKDLTDEDGRSVMFYPIGYYNSTENYDKVSGGSVTSGFRNFEGIFDGNGHTISDFYQNTWEAFGDYNDGYAGTPNHYRDGFGLFGKVYGGTVKNLTVKNFSSDGEFTTTGTIAAYAEGATFENIAIFDCNPRVYNIGNGGIVGCVGWYATDAGLKTTFSNITVDNTNIISALWGSWDVACGGIVGQYYPTSGQSSANYPVNGGIHFENCHVAAQIDVYNDVCANYQYYAYRYAGILMGSVRENVTENGYEYPNMTGITAKDCTVHFGDWNDYYYCELVANSLASYTHDHQMSRLEQVASVDEENLKIVTLDGDEEAIPTAGRVNYVVVKAKDANGMWIHGDGHDYAECYHFVNGVQHFHDVADSDNPTPTETVDGEEGVLKEDKQLVYREFNNLVTGYGWGVTSKGVDDMDGVTILDRVEADSVVKFAEVESHETSFLNGKTVTVGELFKAVDAPAIGIQMQNVQVFVSPVDAANTDIRCIYVPNTSDWTQGTVTLLGVGEATVTITDYLYCEPTTIAVKLTPHICAACEGKNVQPWTEEVYTGATNEQLNSNKYNSIIPGNYYLANDTVMKTAVDLRVDNANETELSLCLNGYTLSSPAKNRLFRVDLGCDVEIYGNDKGGAIMPQLKNHTIGTVAYVADEGTSLSVSNCTIDGENASVAGTGVDAGAGGTIRVQGSSHSSTDNCNPTLLLDNVVMQNCHAVNGINSSNDESKGCGGALSVTAGTVTIKDSKFINCTSQASAGAILMGGGTVNISGSSFAECTAETLAGAVYVYKGTATVTGSTFTGCTSKTAGGAFYVSNGTLNLTDTEIAECVTNSGQTYTPEGAEEGKTYYVGNGSAIFIKAPGQVNIGQGSKIHGNTSPQEGTIVLDGADAVLNMTGGEIYGNASTNPNASCGGIKVNGQFNMSGGHIYDNESGAGTTNNVLVYAQGVATLSGGTISARLENNKINNALNVYQGVAYIKPGMTIDGRIYVAPEQYATDKTTGEVYRADDGGALYISGGTISDNISRPANESTGVTGVLSITGGTFTTNVSNLTAEGYVCRLDAETNLYIVTECTEHSYVNGLCACGAKNEDYVEPTEPEETQPESNDGEDAGGAESESTVPETSEPEVTE